MKPNTVPPNCQQVHFLNDFNEPSVKLIYPSNNYVSQRLSDGYIFQWSNRKTAFFDEDRGVTTRPCTYELDKSLCKEGCNNLWSKNKPVNLNTKPKRQRHHPTPSQSPPEEE